MNSEYLPKIPKVIADLFFQISCILGMAQNRSEMLFGACKEVHFQRKDQNNSACHS